MLEIGTGSGRNTAALREAGFDVHTVSDAEVQSFEVPLRSFDAALSTHAFLHGTPATVQRVLGAAAAALKPGAPFHCTFASKRDARYGQGTIVAPDTFAPDTGDEAGVAHVYFDETGLRSALRAHFIVESLAEENVDGIVGSWAHAQRPSGSVHWFLRARTINA